MFEARNKQFGCGSASFRTRLQLLQGSLMIHFCSHSYFCGFVTSFETFAKQCNILYSIISPLKDSILHFSYQCEKRAIYQVFCSNAQQYVKFWRKKKLLWGISSRESLSSAMHKYNYCLKPLCPPVKAEWTWLVRPGLACIVLEGKSLLAC